MANEEKEYLSRRGDNSIIRQTEGEMRADIAAGVADAVRRAKTPPLDDEDIEKLVEILTAPGAIVGVEHGRQVVTSADAGSYKMNQVYGVTVDTSAETLIHERAFGADSLDIGYTDYSFKAMKSVAYRLSMLAQICAEKSIIPLMVGAMPNLGLYTKPDGPVDNWSELLPAGRVSEALAAQEEAVDYCVHDICYVADYMYEAGLDGVSLDTSGAAGDADLLAALTATERIREKHPDMGVEIGMSSEFVIGMHGRLRYGDTRLAGLYPHDQVKVCEAAGATIFGAVVNTNTSESLAWNLARVCTMLKECSRVATIPIHANVGMGVCGIPMSEVPGQDAVSRVDKALVEICDLDGL